MRAILKQWGKPHATWVKHAVTPLQYVSYGSHSRASFVMEYGQWTIEYLASSVYHISWIYTKRGPI